MLNQERDDRAAGLCGSCVHAEVVRSSRGSEFYRCRRSFTDPRFARYPTLPMRACDGYEAASTPTQHAVSLIPRD